MPESLVHAQSIAKGVGRRRVLSDSAMSPLASFTTFGRLHSEVAAPQRGSRPRGPGAGRRRRALRGGAEIIAKMISYNNTNTNSCYNMNSYYYNDSNISNILTCRLGWGSRDRGGELRTWDLCGILCCAHWRLVRCQGRRVRVSPEEPKERREDRV